jgi:hypothetical protein
MTQQCSIFGVWELNQEQTGLEGATGNKAGQLARVPWVRWVSAPSSGFESL